MQLPSIIKSIYRTEPRSPEPSPVEAPKLHRNRATSLKVQPNNANHGNSNHGNANSRSLDRLAVSPRASVRRWNSLRRKKVKSPTSAQKVPTGCNKLYTSIRSTPSLSEKNQAIIFSKHFSILKLENSLKYYMRNFATNW